ncbi:MULTISPECIES: HNH endonuclease [unclassified Actinotignum]|uniref:HNH endonuclease n=1 Tax=unclassified Actinotignum TaxID=2632702 RepID=UPI002A83B8A8|nr:HNH endonuclease signature motif containing protein [Actinotignum sp. SLA_B059]MDY5127456.1 HNH endonuclease signature motif containing protein [Actinotignum sp. SLA_B059]
MSGRKPWASGRDIAKLRALVIQTYGLECSICHEMIDPRYRSPDPRSFSIDHVLARGLGGSDALENLRPAHRGCNSAKGKRLPARRARRRREIDPAFF